jgi:preprotein translocase subunit SecY
METKEKTVSAWSKRNGPLWRKIFITLGLLVVFRLGSLVSVPGVEAVGRTDSGISAAAMLNLFTGGAMARMSIFALGVMPYITAAIIMQLAAVFIPWVERQRRENGNEGFERITQVTRYLTLVLAAAEASAIIWASAKGVSNVSDVRLNEDITLYGYIAMGVIITAGAVMTMRLGEIITEKGVGNGMSLLIFTSIAAQVPRQIYASLTINDVTDTLFILGGVLLLLVAVVWVEGAIRKVPVRYARRQIGSRIFGAGGSYIPLKINQASVVPVIFASSLMMLPAVLTGLFQPNLDPNHWWFEKVIEPLTDPTNIANIIITIVLVIFFAYFYVSVQNDPDEQAERLAKANGFIPGYRPGDQTARYLWAVMSRLLVVGSVYLAFIATLPNIVMHYSMSGDDNSAMTAIPFAGTSLLILVSVALTTVKSIQGEAVKTSFIDSVLRPKSMNRADKKISKSLRESIATPADAESGGGRGGSTKQVVEGADTVAAETKEGK